MATKRTYEIMYIVKADQSEDDVTKLNESLQGVIEKEGGTIVKLENMGRRKLAYEIKHQSEGHYVLFEIDGSGKEIAELERRMRVNDQIMRFITVRVDEDRKTAEKFRSKREERHARRQNGNRGEQSMEEKMLGSEAETEKE